MNRVLRSGLLLLVLLCVYGRKSKRAGFRLQAVRTRLSLTELMILPHISSGAYLGNYGREG